MLITSFYIDNIIVWDTKLGEQSVVVEALAMVQKFKFNTDLPNAPSGNDQHMFEMLNEELMHAVPCMLEPLFFTQRVVSRHH